MKRFLLLTLILALTAGWAQAFSMPQCETQNCQVCSSLGVCVMCSPNYMLRINKDAKTSQCIQKACGLQNCFRCLTDSVCAQCQAGYKLNSQSLCSKIDDQSQDKNQETDVCSKRSILGKCIKCPQGFNLVDGQCEVNKINLMSLANTVACTTVGTINCGISGTCLTPNYCLTCTSGQIVNANGVCVPQCSNNINNCAYCSTSTSCQICNSGYYLITAPTSTIVGTCVLCNTAGCNQCSSPNICTGCIAGYTLNTTTNACQLSNCQYPCAQCTTSGCSSCLSPYNAAPFDNGTCFTCPIANCLACSPQTPQICTNCNQGYLAINNGASCVFGCSPNCLPSACGSNRACTQCLPGYYVSTSNSNCFPCDGSPICTQCTITGSGTATSCTACIQGYYVNSTNQCAPCAAPNCINCNTNTNGQVCAQFGNGLLTYTSTTSTTTSGVALTFPYQCDPGCSSCLSTYPSACLACLPGFYLSTVNSAPACAPCAGNCASCLSSAPSNCQSCYGNAQLVVNPTTSVGSCAQCNQNLNCLTCFNSVNMCTTCPYGYYLTSINANTVSCNAGCPANCLTCFNAKGTSLSGLNPGNIACSSCDAGYSLSVTGSCLPCVANCRVCTGQYQNQCLQCSDGFYLNSVLQCATCPTYCLTCTAQGCLTCIPGYNPALSGNSLICVLACAYPCASCNNNAPTQCTSCMMGFTLSGNTCQFSSCVTSSTNACEYCPLGSVISGGVCVQCASNCARCNPATPTQCTGCFAGAYLTGSNSCAACGNGCATCSGPYNCLSCQNGYATLAYSTRAPVVPVQTNLVYCTPCIAPCALCTTNAETCTTCIAGFTFTGWNCISTFFYTFSATFNANQQVFFNHYQALINRFTYALQTQNNKAVSVQSISSTQTTTTILVYMTTLEPSGSQNAAAEYNNLVFALTQSDDNQLAGMQLQSSTLSFQGGVVNDYYNSSAVFLGIFIPLGIVLLVGIAYFICSRNDMDLPGSVYYPPVSAESDRSMEPTEMKSI